MIQVPVLQINVLGEVFDKISVDRKTAWHQFYYCRTLFITLIYTTDMKNLNLIQFFFLFHCRNQISLNLN